MTVVTVPSHREEKNSEVKTVKKKKKIVGGKEMWFREMKEISRRVIPFKIKQPCQEKLIAALRQTKSLEFIRHRTLMQHY